MKLSDLKEYVRRLYQLESSVYQQKSLITELRKELDRLNNYQNKQLKDLRLPKPNKFSFSMIKSGLVCVAISALCGLFIFGLASLVTSDDATSVALIMKGIIIGSAIGVTYFIDKNVPLVIWTFVICGTILFTIVGFFVAVIKELGDGEWWAIIKKGPIVGAIMGMVVALTEKRKSEVERHEKNREIELENKYIREQNIKNRAYIDRKVLLLRQELRILEAKLTETKATLNCYYDVGVIFPKYRELVAVSFFHEYLSSGRCFQLEGHEGAYNLFEQKIMQEMIVRKLDNIIERLDDIADNQYMLYSAIVESNRSVQSILREMGCTLQNIESNTAITAYNSGITAYNTECLKWLEFLKR